MPSPFATRLVVTPVAVFRIATCAPGINAPVLSATWPEIVPPETWALTAKGISRMTRRPKTWVNLQELTDGMSIHLSELNSKICLEPRIIRTYGSNTGRLQLMRMADCHKHPPSQIAQRASFDDLRRSESGYMIRPD